MIPELPVVAAACKLAVAFHHARAEAFGLAIQPWENLSSIERHELVNRAVDLLEEYRPAPRRSFDYLRLVTEGVSRG